MGTAKIEIICACCGSSATKRKDNIIAARRKGCLDSCSRNCAQQLSNRSANITSIASLLDRASKTDSGCYEWNGYIDADGYGRISRSTRNGKRPALAHRVAYELANGVDPIGMCVCHSCDNRKCINPEHLWLGTIAENNADMHRKGRWNRVWRPLRST